MFTQDARYSCPILAWLYNRLYVVLEKYLNMRKYTPKGNLNMHLLVLYSQSNTIKKFRLVVWVFFLHPQSLFIFYSISRSLFHLCAFFYTLFFLAENRSTVTSLQSLFYLHFVFALLKVTILIIFLNFPLFFFDVIFFTWFVSLIK